MAGHEWPRWLRLRDDRRRQHASLPRTVGGRDRSTGQAHAVARRNRRVAGAARCGTAAHFGTGILGRHALSRWFQATPACGDRRHAAVLSLEPGWTDDREAALDGAQR